MDFYSSSGNVPVYFVNCPIEELYIGRNIDHWSSNNVFADLSNLHKVEIGKLVTKIPSHLLKGASKLQELTIPHSVIGLGSGAFDECSSLSKVIFEDGDNAIIYTSGRGSVKTGGGTDGIVNYAMFCDSPLEYVYIGRNFKAASNGGQGMFDYTPIKKLDIGDNVTDLVELEYLRELETLILPKNIQTVTTFRGCNNLRTIICFPTIPPEIKHRYDAFSNSVYANSILYVTKGCLELYKTTDVWLNFFDIQEYIESGIDEVRYKDENNVIDVIVDINGVIYLTPSKGINIIRYKNGKVKKVYIQ